MRSRIMVIGRDAGERARLARLLTRGGYRAELAESLAHAHRAGLEGIALAIVDPNGLGANEQAASQELRAAVGKVLIVARPRRDRLSPRDAVDISDEGGLLARIAQALESGSEPEAADGSLTFAGHRLDLAGRSLMDPAGREIPLTHGEFRLLRAFVERSGRVLSREQLLQLTTGRDAEPYDRSVDMQVLRLRRKIERDPKRPSLIVTAPGGGYKLATPVRQARRVETPSKDVDAYFQTAAEISPAPRLSIVVLPFANLSGDPEQDYFADGVTESLTADLSRIRNSFVIARNTAFAYKGKPMDVRAIGHELSVRYVLEGSVQRSGDRMRVSAQLIDAESGGHLWAERFDQPVAELFDLQDAVVGRIAIMLNAEIVAAEARQAERRATPDSMDLYFRAAAWFHRGSSSENMAHARPFLARAQALDPSNVYAITAEAIAYALTALGNYTVDSVALLSAAEAAAARALAIAPDYVAAQYAMGLVLTFTKRAAEGVAACERALALNRNFVWAHGVLGFGKICLGRSEETEAHVHDALRISPRDPDAFMWMAVGGQAAIHLGRNEAATLWLDRSIDTYPSFSPAHFLLAAALGNLNRLEEARGAVEAVLTLDPAFSIRQFRERAPSDNAVYLKQRERIIDGLRRAGAPEG